MKFINYTNDGRVVVQHAALILSKLDETDTLELHTMDNAIILLKKDMTLVETRDVLQGMVRLARSMTLDALCNSDAEDKTPLVDESVDDEYEDTAVVDVMFRTDELNQYLSRMNLTPRWEDGIFDRLVSGEVTGEELAQSRKGCRIWQLKKDVDVAMRFIGYEDQVRKFGEPDAENYTLVFDGDLGTSDLERIYTICRDAPPPGYQGYRMALSDVVELYDDSGSEFYYCDRVGFQSIRFEQKQDPCINMTL